jgi:hypothetical protein
MTSAESDNYIGSVLSLAAFFLALLLIAVAKLQDDRREVERRDQVLNFAPSARSASTLSRRVSE